MKYLKKIEYQEYSWIKRVLTLEHANGYAATYRESATCTITFHKGYYKECLQNGRIKEYKGGD